MPARILLERDGPLAIVKFNDPANLNAVDDAMTAQFTQTMMALLDDADVRAILLTGEGRAFCAGANLKEMSGSLAKGKTPDVGGSLRDFINPVLVRMTEAAKPIIAAVNGAAVGVGCGIALAADIVLIGRSGYFLQSFIRLGVVPDGGSSWTIPRLVGGGQAAAMMMLGDKIDAETAVRWGLAYRVYEDGDLLAAARDMSAIIAHGPTAAYAQIKAMLRASAGNSFAEQLSLEARSQVAAFASEDCREGIAAFVERRKPAFKGR
jgi:2-(1,2-epoxy-1,2-dihydrophenyl)acetyl-CoA isomerase